MTIPRNDNNKIAVGIDMSKDMLEISINGKKTSTIQNAIKRFINDLLTTHSDINHVVFEPTGGYERKLTLIDLHSSEPKPKHVGYG